MISPRTCPDCPIDKTVWWVLTVDRLIPDKLTMPQQVVVARIFGEPGSITVRA